MDRARARLDAYAHNPYPLVPKRETPFTGGCPNCTTISMADLERLTREVTRAFGGKRIWLTEYGYQTNPPDRILGVSQEQQARFVGEAARRAYLAPRVDMLVQFLYRDEPNADRFQSGLVGLDGRPKLAFSAYQFPLAQVRRRGASVSLWGQVRIDVPTYRLQSRIGGGPWRNLTGLRRRTGRGYFTASARLPRGAQVRVLAGNVAGAPLRVL
jgi:hypothetical protein